MRAALLACAAIAVAVALLFARPHPTPGPPMRDFEAYYAAGSVWNAGGDAYSQAIWYAERDLAGVNARHYQALPFVGPPVLLPLFGAIARLPFAAANALWRSLLILCLAALALATLPFARHRPTPFSFAAIAIAALGFGPLTSALALGQIALPAFLCAALALVWPPAVLGAWIQPNLALTMLPQLFTRRTIAPFFGAGALFAAACAAVAGFPGIVRYATVLHAHALTERFSAIQVTPAAIAYGFGAAPQAASAIGATVALGAICCWVMLMLDLRETGARFCATCALLPLAVPFFHEHDLLVLFVPALCYATRATPKLWPAACGGAMLAATDWLGLAQRPDGVLQTLLLIGGLGAALIALHERPRPRMLLVPAAVLALIGAAALFAHSHPAPVWPDAMAALPHNAGTLGIEAAWNAEQQATGLFVHEPVWAALRLLSLCGCILTAAAIALSSRYPADSRSPSPVPA